MDNMENHTWFCEDCGNKVLDSDKFCEHCGAEIKPLPTTFTNNSTEDKKSNKKIIVIISAVSVLVVVLAIVSVILFGPKMSGDKELQTTGKITQQMTTENLTTAEPTTVKPSIVAPTTAEPTTVEPTTIKPTKEDENNNSNGSDRCYFDGFSIELPDNFTYEVTDDIVEFFEVYNYEHPKTGFNGYLFSIEKTTKGPADFASATKLGSKDGLNYMLTYPLGMGLIEDEYAGQCRRDAINEMNDVIATFRIE